ncbi:DegV family protein [Levilactobacillus namurensis]|uniref:DegV family protein n=1 Tax=Levilactobacillus namurensis TaxID=380393 RepID=A0AAW8W461_9LACO|nr:DegV family protein [Levilactobacillus namurensis]MDT7013041.1 DegV family protein [Levilactobacillus namurensis]
MQTEKIAILVDSCSDVPASVLQAADMALLPVNVIFRDRVYEDRVTITPAEFYRRQATEQATTASPTGKTVLEAFERIQESGYTHVLGVCISDKLSGTFQEVKLLSEDSPLKVHMVNTKNIGIGSGFAAIYAARLRDQGLAFDDLVAEVERVVRQTKVFFYIPNLKYLVAGGRVGRVAGMAGTLLNVKPIISCDPDGVFAPVAKARGEKRALAKLISLVGETIGDHQQVSVSVVDGANPELRETILAQLQAAYPQVSDWGSGDISPALGVHTGPGLVGVGIQVRD